MSRVGGTVRSIAGRRVTVTLDEFTLELAQAVAAREGMTTSAWLAAAARHEAVRQAAGPDCGPSEGEAIADDAEALEV